MGDNFLEAQARNTKKRRAKGAAEIGEPRLIVRPDEVRDRFTVDCSDGFELSAGEMLHCFPAQDDAVHVARGHQTVGHVGELGGGRALSAEVQDAGVGRLRVVSFDALAGSAQVERVREDASDGHER